MVRVYAEVELDDFYNELDKYEKQELIELLVGDDLIPGIVEKGGSRLMNDEFNISCVKLAESYYQMSKEDIDLVESIIKKYN